MTVEAYVLVEVDIGKAPEVAEALAKLKGVRSAQSVTGPYDIIAAVEVAELGSLGRLMSELHPIAGMPKDTIRQLIAVIGRLGSGTI